MTQEYRPKLIEVALPLVTINRESAREKSIRHGHPSTLHQWWARRPLAAARAVLWASLVDDPSGHPESFPTPEQQQVERDRLFDILERLVPWEASMNPSVLAEAKAEIDKCFDGDPPPILDPFGGGGAIPLEAQRLGLTALSGDLNPVAVLIQKAMIEIPPRFSGLPPVHPNLDSRLTTWSGTQGLAADIEAYGRWMQEEAQRRIGNSYPKVNGPSGDKLTPIAWLWARTVESPDPSWSGRVPLVKSWVLFNKRGKPTIWVEPLVDPASQTITYRVREGGQPPPGTVAGGRGGSGGMCIATGAPIPFSYIREESRRGQLGQQLLAIVAEAPGGRVYLDPSLEDAAAAAAPVGDLDLIEGDIFDIPGRINVVRYGMTQWSALFTPRQSLALLTFSDLLSDVREMAVSHAQDCGRLPVDERPICDGGSGPEAYGDALVTYLAFALDKAANMWSNIVSWMNDRGAFREVFARQAIPMVWDFAEANPFSESGGSWTMFVDKIQQVVAHLPANGEAHVVQQDARTISSFVESAAISTDPPYYDNIHYADLSDFFYVWLRRSLRSVWPQELATLATPKAEELIAHQYRAGSKEAAFEHFEDGMTAFAAEAARIQRDDVPATLYYAFRQQESAGDGRVSTGWETFLSGLLSSGLSITATWPLRTESPGRAIAQGTNALASSIVIACRPRSNTAGLETRGGFVGALRGELPEAVRLLQHENIAPVDLAQSAIGPGMRIFSRYAKVVEADGSAMTVRSALALINEVLGEALSAEESELDADSRFALTWFDQFGHNPGAYGDADVLARAKDTSVAGVVDAGIAVARHGKLRLLERAELPQDWAPLLDARATVWEATQHLIRRLGESELGATDLLAQLGGVADRARQLAYLLYGVCERNGWTDEAIAYNGLITAWPELVRLAAGQDPGSAQQTLV